MLANKKKTMDEALPIFEIENGLVVFKDGRVAAGFGLDVLEMEKFAAPRYAHLCDVFTGSMRILPPGSTVQKLDCYYYEPFQAGLSASGFFEKNMIQHFYNRQVLKHKSYLCVSLGEQDPPPANPVNTLFAYGKAFLTDSPF